MRKSCVCVYVRDEVLWNEEKLCVCLRKDVLCNEEKSCVCMCGRMCCGMRTVVCVCVCPGAGVVE